MAIMGTLAEIPLPELVRTLEKRTGKLSIRVQPQESDYYLYVDKARLKALYLDEKSLENSTVIRETLTELSRLKEGNYVFKSISEEVMPESCNVGLRLLFLKISQSDETVPNKDRLPAAQTRFERSDCPEVEVWPSESLKDFWLRTASLFAKGCNAEEIAKELNLDVEQARVSLYKLRCTGQISPVRSFGNKLSPANSSITTVTQKNKPNIEKSLVESINNLSFEEILIGLKKPQKLPVLEKQRNPSKSPIRKGLASRLLKALSKHR